MFSSEFYKTSKNTFLQNTSGRLLLPFASMSSSLHHFPQKWTLSLTMFVHISSWKNTSQLRECFYISDFVRNYNAFRDLVPFAQFKKREKHWWRSVTFSRVLFLAEACNSTKSNILPFLFFTFKELYKWYQMAESITFANVRKPHNMYSHGRRKGLGCALWRLVRGDCACASSLKFI